jgi:hypothetical protein
MSVGSQIEVDERLTDVQMEKLGRERVRDFNRKWGVLGDFPEPQTQAGEDSTAKPQWWENSVKNHIFENTEITSPVLKSLYSTYLNEYYGAKEEADLKKIFIKDKDFSGSAEDEEKAFGRYLFENFTDWMKGSAPSAIAAEREKFEDEPEKGEEKARKSERESGERVDLKINWGKVSEFAPWLRSQFREFVKIWESGNVVEFSLAIEDDAITHIGLIGDGGKFASLPVDKVFDAVDGMEYFKNNTTGKVGFKYSTSGEYIDPDTGIKLAKHIISKAAIDNKKLNSDFWIHFQNDGATRKP